MDKYDDQQLKSLLADSQTRRRAFETMVRQYSEQLYWIIRRMVLVHEDADDVLQNTLIKAWNALDNFHGDSKLITWLSRIAINESLDFIRRQKNVVTMSTDDLQTGVAQTLMADRYFDGDETQAQLQAAIATLPEVQRAVFNLRYFDKMKYSDMSKLMNTSEGALKASYHIAVKKIKDYFTSYD